VCEFTTRLSAWVLGAQFHNIGFSTLIWGRHSNNVIFNSTLEAENWQCKLRIGALWAAERYNEHLMCLLRRISPFYVEKMYSSTDFLPCGGRSNRTPDLFRSYPDPNASGPPGTIKIDFICIEMASSAIEPNITYRTSEIPQRANYVHRCILTSQKLINRSFVDRNRIDRSVILIDGHKSHSLHNLHSR
jgi:hypothetical protein